MSEAGMDSPFIPRTTNDIFERVIASEAGNDTVIAETLRTFAHQKYLETRGLREPKSLDALREILGVKFKTALAKLELWAQLNMDGTAFEF